MSFRNELIYALREMERQLGSLNQVATRLCVDRAGLKRFLDNERGLTSRTLEKILDGLDAHIVWGFQIDPEDESPTAYERRVAQVLQDTARVLGKTPHSIAGKGYGGMVSPEIVESILDGKRAMSVYDLHRISMAIGVSATNVLQRASELMAENLPQEAEVINETVA